MVVAFVLVLIEADFIKDEELGLRPEIGGLSQADAFHVLGRFACDVSRVSWIIFSGHRIANVADHHEGLGRKERIKEGGRRHGLHQHVRLIDDLPSSNAGTVEAETALECILSHFSRRDGKMLPESREIHKSHVNHLDTFPFDQFQHLF